jgi:hypothetical protein
MPPCRADHKPWGPHLPSGCGEGACVRASRRGPPAAAWRAGWQASARIALRRAADMVAGGATAQPLPEAIDPGLGASPELVAAATRAWKHRVHPP